MESDPVDSTIPKGKENDAAYLKELQRSNEELEEFGYAVSHDLKSPLHSIDHLVGWVLDDEKTTLSETSKKNLLRLRERIAQMTRLVDDLLNYARVADEKFPPSQVNLKELVKNIGVLLGAESFTLAVDTEVPVICTQQVPLEQVIRNLITNAIKHHHQARGTVTVRCRATAEQEVEISVQDDGPGIPVECQTQIFEMFKTLKPKQEGGGSGIGLALVKKRVESAGGSIGVKSQEGLGSTFFFRWPVTKGL